MGKLEIIRNKDEKIFEILPLPADTYARMVRTGADADFNHTYKWYVNHIGKKFAGEVKHCRYAGRNPDNRGEDDPCALCCGYVRAPWMKSYACWGLRGCQTLRPVKEGE